MEKKIKLVIVSILITLTSYSQTDKGSQHVGVAGLLIFDLFNFYPENEISGGAININYGIFIRNNLSFGLNIYRAGASNEYGTEAADFHRENQKIRLMGLNSNLRYYHSLSKRILIFTTVSFGFGNYKIETTNLSNLLKVNEGIEKESVGIIMTGVGLNYCVMNNLTLELNIPYIFVKRFSTDPYAENFHTIVPTIGIQYYWNKKE